MQYLGKKWGHLVKALEVKDGPAGLYPEPRVWAEGKDWEGYKGNFSYGFFKEPCVCHPVEGALVHPYDEVLVFAGINLEDIRSFEGGEVSIELGEEREEYVFSEPSVICLPKGTVHGPVTIRKVGRPIVHFLFGLDPVYRAEAIPEKARAATTTAGQKYAHLVHPLRTNMSQEMMQAMADVGDDAGFAERIAAAAAKSKTGMGYEALCDSRGVLHPKNIMGPGNGQQICWMFGEDLNGLDFNFSWGFFDSAGKWHRPGEGHTHPEVEALVFVGLNPDDLGELGAELAFKLGPEFEDQIFDRPTSVICPEGFVHLPLVTRWVDKTYGMMVGCLGGVHEAPWVNPEDLD
jgi:hypothetical protein